MIHVDLRPEPDHFDIAVRKPGNVFLAKTPQPTSTEWKQHAYWTKISQALHDSYTGICAYTCHWIAYDTGGLTVEHFLPKSKHPRKAYEWDNYRLVCSRLNGRRGTSEKILDPFSIQNGWFTLEFPSLLVKPGIGLAADLIEQIYETCRILKLNDESTCKRSRMKYVANYCAGRIDFQHLESEAPFIAQELARQNLKEKIKEMWI